MVASRRDEDYKEAKEAQEVIFQEIEDTLKRRSISEERAMILVTEAKAAGVSLRTISEMIFDGKKFREIIAFLKAQRHP